MNFVVSSAFATESIAAQELKQLGIYNVKCKDNKVYFSADAAQGAKACVWLRSADRLGLLIDEFAANTFDELFDGIKSLKWNNFIDRNSKIIVQARCVRSKIMSQRDVQRVSKKAIINSLSASYKTTYFSENGTEVFINVSILNDIATVVIDLCGDGLHKRGYRLLNSEAPLRETLAASLLLLSGFDGTGTFLDPFCGSGTLPIEAAMISCNIAPGRNRRFAAENYGWISNAFKEEKQKAFDLQKKMQCEILCGDIDSSMVDIANYHAQRAGVDITVKCRDACSWDDVYHYNGIMVTNPPYGERLLDKQMASELMQNFSSVTSDLLEKYWKIGIITPESDLEKLLYAKCSSKRKIFNSNIQCTYFQFQNLT